MFSRHCEPTGPASGRPEDKLSEPIQAEMPLWIASSLSLGAMTGRIRSDRNIL
jgi:hypothetical protein